MNNDIVSYVATKKKKIVEWGSTTRDSLSVMRNDHGLSIFEVEMEEGATHYSKAEGFTREARPVPDRWKDIKARRNKFLRLTDKFLIPDFPIAEAELATIKEWRSLLYAAKDGYLADPDGYMLPVPPIELE